MPGITINPKFEQLLPPLTIDELDKLEASILAEGIREPLIVWNNGNVLVDGHNRYRLAHKHQIEFDVRLVDFESEHDVINWMINNQLSRRNLTKEQKSYLIGQRYQNEKNNRGGDYGNQYTKEANRQNDGLPTTAEKIAEQSGVSPKTVERDAEFAKGVDAIGAVSPELKTNILSGKTSLTKEDVAKVAKLSEDKPEAVEALAKNLDQADSVDAQARAVKLAVKGKTHVTNNSGNEEWYTPPEYLDAARTVLEQIDLDPASNPEANQTVQADVFYTKDDDGLKQKWAGRVWMNPPYTSGVVDKFVAKLTDSFESGSVTEAIVLVNNATETKWFQELAFNASAIVFKKGRIQFIGQALGSALQGQAFIYLGKNPDKFLQVFAAYGFGCKLHSFAVEQPEPEEAKPLSEMGIRELKKAAAGKGLSGVNYMSKDQLIEALSGLEVAA